MTAIAATINRPRKIRIRGVALPNEHGAWGFLFEPLVVAVAVVPSISSIWISLLFVSAFLLRQPLKIFLADLIAKRNLPQTSAALKFIGLYGAIFSVGLIGTFLYSNSYALIPIILIIPIAIYQIYCDVFRQSRNLLPELTGAVAISSSAFIIALSGGWTSIAAAALWAVLFARLIPSIFYVRNRLKLEKGKEFSLIIVAATHFAAFALVGILVVYDLIPKLTLLMFFVLLFRAIWGLSPYRQKVKAVKIGIFEVIYGLLTILSIIIGFYFQI